MANVTHGHRSGALAHPGVHGVISPLQPLFDDVVREVVVLLSRFMEQLESRYHGKQHHEQHYEDVDMPSEPAYVVNFVLLVEVAIAVYVDACQMWSCI